MKTILVSDLRRIMPDIDMEYRQWIILAALMEKNPDAQTIELELVQSGVDAEAARAIASQIGCTLINRVDSID